MMKDKSVFYISAIFLLLIVLFGIIAPKALETATENIQNFITDYFGWYYLIVATIFLIVCIYLFITPMGRIKLGNQDDKPDFTRSSCPMKKSIGECVLDCIRRSSFPCR
jgi:glycine betaine transporter